MNLSQEYIDLMELLLKEGQNHGILLNPIDALINAAHYGPEISLAEIDLINSNAAEAANVAKAMKDLKKPAEEMKVNLTSTLMGNGFTLQEAKVISGEENEDPK